MTDLSTLRAAFDALEERADAAGTAAPIDFPPARRPMRVLAPVGAAVAVAATAAVVVVWQQSGSTRPTGTPAGDSSAAIPPASTAAPTPSATTSADRFPPSTGAALTAKAREILAGTATIAVTETDVPGAVTLSVPSGPPASTGRPAIADGSGVALPTGGGSGAALVGTLSAGGRTGGFQLVAYQTAPGSKATCDGDTDCTVRSLPDGTSLAVGSWHDDEVAGGVTYQVEAVRPDGKDVLMHLSTERDPKGHSTTITSALPLTVAQMTAFVTSDRW